MVVEILNLCTQAFINVYLESMQVNSMTGELSRQGCNSDHHVCLANMTHRKLLEQKIKGHADTYFQHVLGRFKAGT